MEWRCCWKCAERDVDREGIRNAQEENVTRCMGRRCGLDVLFMLLDLDLTGALPRSGR